MVNWSQGLKFRCASFLGGAKRGGGDNADTIWAPGDMFRWPHSYFFPISPSPSHPLFYFRIGSRGRAEKENSWCFYCEVGGKYFAESVDCGWRGGLGVSFYLQPSNPHLFFVVFVLFDGGVSTLYYVLHAVRMKGAQAQHNWTYVARSSCGVKTNMKFYSDHTIFYVIMTWFFFFFFAFFFTSFTVFRMPLFYIVSGLFFFFLESRLEVADGFS